MFTKAPSIVPKNQSSLEFHQPISQSTDTITQRYPLSLNDVFPLAHHRRFARESQLPKSSTAQRQENGPMLSFPIAKNAVASSSSSISMVNQKLSRQFYKTRMCPFFERGHCRKEDQCTYAHSKNELKTAPNLYKTKLCENWQNGSCTEDINCRFAHGRQELRFTSQVYKTRMCHFWLTAECSKGQLCRHAHGSHELRVDAKDTVHEDIDSKVDHSDIPLPLESYRFARRRRSYTTSFLTGLRETKLDHFHDKLLPQSSFSGKESSVESHAPEPFSAAQVHSDRKKVDQESAVNGYQPETMFDLPWNLDKSLNPNQFYTSDTSVATEKPKNVRDGVGGTTLSSFPQDTQQRHVDTGVDHSSFQELQSPKWEATEHLTMKHDQLNSCLRDFTSTDPLYADSVNKYITSNHRYLEERSTVQSALPYDSPTPPSDFFYLFNHETSPTSLRQDSLCDFQAFSSTMVSNPLSRFDSLSCGSQRGCTPGESLDTLTLQNNKQDDSLSAVQVFQRSSSSPLSLLDPFQTTDQQPSCLNETSRDNAIANLTDAFQAALQDTKTCSNYFPISSHHLSSRPLSTSPTFQRSKQQTQSKSLLLSSFSLNSLYSEINMKPLSLNSGTGLPKFDKRPPDSSFFALQALTDEVTDTPSQSATQNPPHSILNADSSSASVSQNISTSAPFHLTNTYESVSTANYDIPGLFNHNFQVDSFVTSGWVTPPEKAKSQGTENAYNKNISHGETASKLYGTTTPSLLNAV